VTGGPVVAGTSPTTITDDVLDGADRGHAAEDFSTSLTFISGKEYSFDTLGVLHNVGAYGARLRRDVHGDQEPDAAVRTSITAGRRRRRFQEHRHAQDFDSRWWGYAGYVAYDWTRSSAPRSAASSSAIRLGRARGAGQKVDLWEMTGTLQYKIWKGLMGRVEFRHDQADEKVFQEPWARRGADRQTQDTLTFVLDYLFF